MSDKNKTNVEINDYPNFNISECICPNCLKYNRCELRKKATVTRCDYYSPCVNMPPVKPAKPENAAFHVDFEPTGILRTMDDLGRVAIPKDIRKSIGIHEGDTIEIFASKSGEILMRKCKDGEDNG